MRPGFASSGMEGKPAPRARSLEGILSRLSPPEVEPSLADLVKRPTPRTYAQIKRATPEERLRGAFALTAFAHNLGERAREARS